MSATARGTAVAVGARGLLIVGPSGSGKSSLALEMISRGARLVGDDLVTLARSGDALVAGPPPRCRGMIEARGVGLLSVPRADEARLVAVADLGAREDERLPPRRGTTLEGVSLRLFHAPSIRGFAAALHVYLLGHDE